MSALSSHDVKGGMNDCLPEDVWPIGKKAAFYSCFIVFLLGTFDFIDRQVLAALLPYIKVEWALSDTQLGLLVSIVNIVMSILVIPSAYLIDKWSRKKMIAIMGAIWSLGTALCALAGNYTHMFMSRMLIGFGEAGYNPAAQALISAQFPAKYRGTAIAFTQLGLSFGAPLGLIIGAYVASHWGWRYAFGIVAIPGFILAMLALFIKDYKSIDVSEHKAVDTDNKDEVKEVALPYPVILGRVLRTPSLLCIFAGAVMTMMHGGAQTNWLPSYLERVGGMPLTTASNIAALTLFSALISIAVTGPVIDWFRKNTKRGAPAFVACAGLTASVLFYFVYGVITPGSTLQIIGLMAAQLCIGVSVASGPIIAMDLSHPGSRATTAGMLIFGQNLFGFALGPLIVGSLSDTYGLSTALFTIATIAPIFISLAYFICTLSYRRDLDKVDCVSLDFSDK